MVEETEVSLLDRAEIEEKNYKWEKAAELYEKAAEILNKEKNLENAAKVYNKLGDICLRAVFASETKDGFLNWIEQAVKAFNKAESLFIRRNDKFLGMESKAKALYTMGYAPSSIEKGKAVLKESINLCLELNKIYSSRNDKENLINSYILILKSISRLFILCKNATEFNSYLQMNRNLTEKAWTLLKDINNIDFKADLVYLESLSYSMNRYTALTYRDEKEEDIRKKFFVRCKEVLGLVNNCDDFYVLGRVYLAVGIHYGMFGTIFVEEHYERLELVEKCFALLEKSSMFCRSSGNYVDMIISIYTRDYLASLFGRFNYLQKRIFRDTQELQKFSEIYDGLYTFHGLLTSRTSMMYYHNFAARSFLKKDTRKSYAKLGIKYAKKQFEKLSFGPFYPLTYQILTHLYSILVILAEEDDPQEEYIQKMFYYADQAEMSAKEYKGGNARSAGFDSIYRANKTMVDIVKNKREKINHLKIAIEAQNSNIKYAIESDSVYFAAQLRLGLLYEELGILANEEKSLMEARELFLRVIKEVSEKGYLYYSAACYEYIARLEDRLGNHMISAEYYEKAQNAHEESLSSIEYKPLKDRVNNKIKYANAWSLIENAKANHKREKHLVAKTAYEKACNILRELPDYNYEASYFYSWAILENAEQHSKLENFLEAIKCFQKAEDNFRIAKMAIRYKRKMERASKDLKKLEKVANIRIDYCSARTNLEKARILAKEGDHLNAAERFGLAATQINNICSMFKIKRERGDLEAVYYLCKAWENMEIAEIYEDPKKYSMSAELFSRASELFRESKLKSLAIGNSNFCLALEQGCNFDKSHDIDVKKNLFLKVKSILRNAADAYEKGGFENAADWALAISTYFDAAWHLIQADYELRIDKRKELLNIGVEYLKASAKLFNKAGYKNKEKEVIERVKRVNKEEKILISALNTIKKPSISSSTEGIVAPSCPIETSQSPRIGEIQQYTEEVSMFLEKDSKIEKLTDKIRVFVSYATADSDYFQVSNISNLLAENPDIGKVFYWEEDLQDDIYEYMNKNLAKCDIFLIFCSANTNQSEPVQMEWQAALKIKKKIIPVFINESDIPPLLSTKLGVKFIENDIKKTTDQIYQLVLKKLNL